MPYQGWQEAIQDQIVKVIEWSGRGSHRQKQIWLNCLVKFSVVNLKFHLINPVWYYSCRHCSHISQFTHTFTFHHGQPLDNMPRSLFLLFCKISWPSIVLETEIGVVLHLSSGFMCLEASIGDNIYFNCFPFSPETEYALPMSPYTLPGCSNYCCLFSSFGYL